MSPKVVVSSAGEVLVGAEVDETFGKFPSVKEKRRLRIARRAELKRQAVQARAMRQQSPAVAPNSPAPKIQNQPTVSQSRKKRQKAFVPSKKRMLRLTPVVPMLFGQASPSYIVENGQIVAKGRNGWKKAKKKRGCRNQAQSVQGAINSQPVPTGSAQQHLGNKDYPDASRTWAQNYRDKGKYGSFPIHDAHGDESIP